MEEKLLLSSTSHDDLFPVPEEPNPFTYKRFRGRQDRSKIYNSIQNPIVNETKPRDQSSGKKSMTGTKNEEADV